MPRQKTQTSSTAPARTVKQMTISPCLRMLVVEDHIALAKNQFEYFDQETYALDFASNGLAALHLLTVNDYDRWVPGISSFELCRRIRQDLL